MSNEELAARIKAGVDVAENMLLLWEQTKDFIRCMARRYQGGMTLKEIGEVYGASIDAVRQSEKAGLRALRWTDGGRLRAFLPEAEEAQAYRHCGAREFGTTWTSSTERVAMHL